MSGKWGRRMRTVYAYDVIDLRGQNSRVAIGYVGKTSSALRYRDSQHKAGKVWAWAVVGEIYPVWQGECGRIQLWFREVYYIHKLRPLFNVEHNKRNPNRIPPWAAQTLYGRPARAYH